MSRSSVSRVVTPMHRQIELDLVARLRNGEPAAFDDVYAVFNCRLFGFLLRLSRSRDVAEELLDETWLRLVRRAAMLAADTRLAPWLFTVARNLYVSYCRNRALEDELHAHISLWPAPIADSPFETAAGSELEGRVEAAIAALPRTLREALLLVGVEGLTPFEAAAICGVKPEAMRQRLSRARAALAARLNEDGVRPSRRLREVRP